MVARVAAGKKRAPLDHCPYIQDFTGGLVTCEELRPDALEFFELVRRQAAGVPGPARASELSLVDRRERDEPIDFPDRRQADINDRKVA